MKKVGLLIILVMTMVLSSCTFATTYEEALDIYETHLEENRDLYQERIAFLNTISSEMVRGVVKVKKSSSNLTSITLGSGLIFSEDNLYYYVLTNNHVVYDIDVQGSVYTVDDFQNNTYNATYIVGNNDYDLAILRIRKKPRIILHVFTFSTQALDINSHLTSIGYPESQVNAINTGVLLDYGPITIDMPSSIINVKFDVMIADLPLKSGSSGSAAVNDRFELVGIIFAGNFSGGSNIADYAFLIPIDKVKEFLTLYDMNYHEVKT